MRHQSVFDGHELTLPCSHCGEQTKKAIGWIKSHPEFTCDCGVTTFKADELISGIHEAEDQLDKLRRDISRMLR